MLTFLFIVYAVKFANGLAECENTEEIPVPANPGEFPEDYNAELVGKWVDNWTPDDVHNVEEYSSLFDGDIMMSAYDASVTPRPPIGTIWPNAIMPYVIDPKHFTLNQKKMIRDAMLAITRQTKFRFRVYCKAKDRNYVVFQSAKTGCWSYVGMQKGGQVINLQKPNCMKKGTIMHAIFHAMGFYHCHNIPIRDNWLKIKWENIIPTKKYNFNLLDQGNADESDILYDYDSIMHGGPYLNSYNDKPVMEPKISNVKIGQRETFTMRDAERVRRVYADEIAKRVPVEELPIIMDEKEYGDALRNVTNTGPDEDLSRVAIEQIESQEYEDENSIPEAKDNFQDYQEEKSNLLPGISNYPFPITNYNTDKPLRLPRPPRPRPTRPRPTRPRPTRPRPTRPRPPRPGPPGIGPKPVPVPLDLDHQSVVKPLFGGSLYVICVNVPSSSGANKCAD